MALNFVAIDFETATSKWDTVCSVAMVRVRNGNIVDTYSTLVNPGCDFCAVNTRIHGISKDDVSDAPVFPTIASAIFAFIGNDILVAHNMAFDGNVLKKTCDKFGISNIPNIRTLCTLLCAQRCIPNVNNYRLPTLCTHYGIQLENHHDAVNDATACAELLIHMVHELNADNLDEFSSKIGVYYGSIQARTVVSSSISCKGNSRHSVSTIQICGLPVYSFYFDCLRILLNQLQPLIDCSALRFQIHQNNTITVHTTLELFRLSYFKSKGFFILTASNPRELADSLSNLRIEAATNPCDYTTPCSRIFIKQDEDIVAITDYLAGIIQTGPVLSKEHSCNIDPTALRLTADDFNDKVKNCSFSYSDPFVLLEDLRSLNPDIANEIDMEQLSDGRTVSYKCCGGLLFYLVDNGKLPFVKTNEIKEPTNIHKAATQYKSGEYKYPLNSSFRYRQFLLAMVTACQTKQIARASDQFGCCNDFIRCSDAKRCLYTNVTEMRGCLYRKNLEAGHIFYGINKNI